MHGSSMKWYRRSRAPLRQGEEDASLCGLDELHLSDKK